MENVTAKTQFKTDKGYNVTVTAELLLNETIYADGDSINVECCKMGVMKADLDGFPQQIGFSTLLKPIRHPDGWTVYATIGKLGLNSENLKKVKELKSELEKHPAWIAKQSRIENNQREIAKMESARNNHPGYCQKCHSYCYGDCDAN